MIRRVYHGMIPVGLVWMTLAGTSAEGTVRVLELSHKIGGIPMSTLELMLAGLAGAIYLAAGGLFAWRSKRTWERRYSDTRLPWHYTALVLLFWPILALIAPYFVED